MLIGFEAKASDRFLPVHSEWDVFSDLVSDEPVTMEFRLVYQGPLHSTGNKVKNAPGKKHAIRRYFHKQLSTLWRTVPALKMVSLHILPERYVALRGYTLPVHATELVKTYSRGTKRYLPLICEENDITCSLDILLLRRDFESVVSSGDLDGRVKTLIDALAIPVIGENAEEGDEDPLYCLMSDDKRISEVKVTGDYLFADPEQIVESQRIDQQGNIVVGRNHVIAVVNIKTRGGMTLWS